MSEAARPLRPPILQGGAPRTPGKVEPFIMETVQDTEEQDLLFPVAACWLVVHILAPTHKTEA